MPSPDCLVLHDKKVNVTSFQSLGLWKSILGTKKLGHTGTLDRFASGLLVLVGAALTKLTHVIHEFDKEYVAIMRLGLETSTLDPEGEVVRTAPTATLERLKELIPEFLGTHPQVPPVYSAVKIAGRRASTWVRGGKEPNLKPRMVVLKELEVAGASADTVSFRIVCGTGFYVRSLVRDWTARAGSAGYLNFLRRTRVGPFRVEEAQDRDGQGHYLVPREVFSRLPGWQTLEVSPGSGLRIQQGILPPELYGTEAEKVACFDVKGVWQGAFERTQGNWKFVCLRTMD